MQGPSFKRRRDARTADATALSGAGERGRAGHRVLQRTCGNRNVLQRTGAAPSSSAEPAPKAELEARIEGARGRGRPLDANTISSFEAAFDADFSGVRVHTNPEAHSLSSAFRAVAFTTGRDIFFRHGAYQPGSWEGKRLLAHELTHVIQQNPSSVIGSEVADVQAKLEVSQPFDPYEVEAEHAADQVMRMLDHASNPVAARGSVLGPLSRVDHGRPQLQKDPAPPAQAGAPAIAATQAQQSAGVSWVLLLQTAKKFYGMPYGLYDNDTIADLEAKMQRLRNDLKLAARDTPPPNAKSPSDDDKKKRQEAQNKIAALDSELTAVRAKLAEAKAQKLTKDEAWKKVKDLVERKPAPSQEVIEVIQEFGIVCNTFVEVVMSTSGFSDFPLTAHEYLPQTETYQALEKAREVGAKQAKAPVQYGFSLTWAERMVDWATVHGEVLYDTSTSELPVPKAGDIVIFGSGTSAKHVNLVVEVEPGVFNFAGAHKPGVPSSQTSITGGFKRYDETKGGQKIPSIMGHEKYLWILRPKYKQPDSAQLP